MGRPQSTCLFSDDGRTPHTPHSAHCELHWWKDTAASTKTTSPPTCMPPQSRENGTPLELTIKLSNTAAANLNPLELDMFEITRHHSLMADNADGCASTFPGGISDGERALVRCEIALDPHGTCGKKLIPVETWHPA